jgi:hypothetical protein
MEFPVETKVIALPSARIELDKEPVATPEAAGAE